MLGWYVVIVKEYLGKKDLSLLSILRSNGTWEVMGRGKFFAYLVSCCFFRGFHGCLCYLRSDFQMNSRNLFQFPHENCLPRRWNFKTSFQNASMLTKMHPSNLVRTWRASGHTCIGVDFAMDGSQLCAGVGILFFFLCGSDIKLAAQSLEPSGSTACS